MNKKQIRNLVALAVLAVGPLFASAQSQKPNWYNLDLKTDSVFGISTEKAYNELLKGKKSKRVIVGILDSGVDFDHEDLKSVIWHNLKERAGNSKDDDRNGYVDDVLGWSFLGGKNGNVDHENLELTRLVRKYQAKFANTTATEVAEQDKADYERYLKLKVDYDKQLTNAKRSQEGYVDVKNRIDALVKKTGKENPTVDDLKAVKIDGDDENILRENIIRDLATTDFLTFYKDAILG